MRLRWIRQVVKHISVYIISSHLVFLHQIGNVYIADNCNHRIRKVTVSTGIISTIAGTGAAGFSGDGGAATSAALYWPQGLALDSSGMYPFFDSFSFLVLITLR